MSDSIGDLGMSPNVETRCEPGSVEWVFKVDYERQRAWDWSLGDPPLRSLGMVRLPSSTAKSRHAPVRTCSYTTKTVLRLESGLELDLVRALDRSADVAWIVPQPALLRFAHRKNGRKLSHVPDLLTVATNPSQRLWPAPETHGVHETPPYRTSGAEVTLWDARAVAKRDDDFRLKASLTADACAQVGWCYRLFDQLPGVMRINLMWLHNYRRPQPWYASAGEQVRALAARGGATIADVQQADHELGHGAGLMISAMWHLLWSGTLHCDLTERITRSTLVRESDR